MGAAPPQGGGQEYMNALLNGAQQGQPVYAYNLQAAGQAGRSQPGQARIVGQPLQSVNRMAGELSTCSSTNLPSGYADGSPLLGVNSVTVPVTTTMVSPRMPLLPDHSAGFAELGRPTMVPSLQSGQLLGVHVSAAIKEKI